MPVFEAVSSIDVSKVTWEQKRLFDVLKKRGITARFVGGWVRDTYLRKAPKDVDIAVDAPPEEVDAALRAEGITTIPTGLKHGTITALVEARDKPGSHHFELTSLRQDVETDGRHAEVKFTNNWLHDATRRDFTFNAMYADLDGRLYDPYDGRYDLKNGVVRFVGNPADRIKEDHLRILRYFRFVAKMNFSTNVDQASLAACLNHLELLKDLSAERVTDELMKTLAADDCYYTLADMVSFGVLDYWLPERRDYLGDLFKILSKPYPTDPAIRFAALVKTGSDVSVIASRLKFSNALKDRVRRLVKPALPLELEAGTKMWRQYIFTMGAHAFMDRVKFEADNAHTDAALVYAEHWQPPQPPFTGHDAMAFGIKGDKLGPFLSEARWQWQKSDFQLTREQCLTWMKDHAAEYKELS